MKLFNNILLFYIKKNRRKYLINTDFSIVAPNCWWWFIYKYFGLKYNTPFVGLFLYLEDYILLLENFEYFMRDSVLSFIPPEQSKYFLHIKSSKYFPYPIGLLDDRIEIHFLHYLSQEEAKIKWNTRTKRLNFDNLLVKLSETHDCTLDIKKRFNLLPFKNKICLYHSDYNYTNCILLKSEKCMDWKDEWKFSKSQNLVAILNGLK